MFIPYIAGMFTMFGLFVFKEIIKSSTIQQNFYLHNQTIIISPDQVYFPYETVYLRATASKYKEYESILYDIVKNQLNPVCTEKDYQIYLNQSSQICLDI